MTIYLDRSKDYHDNSLATLKLRFNFKDDNSHATFIESVPRSVSLQSNIINFESPSIIECTYLNTQIMTSLAISYNDGLSYEHLNGIAFYYYKQPVVTSVKPTRIVVDSDTGIVLTSTDLEFSKSADHYYCMLIRQVNGSRNKFRASMISDTELLCQIDSHGLDIGDYMLSLSANGLNGDYRRVSEDDTEFISIIEDDYPSMQCIPNTVSSKGGTEVMLTSPSFTDMTAEQKLSNNSTMSLKNVRIELRSDLSNSSSEFLGGSYKHISLVRVVKNASLAFKMPSWSYEIEQESFLFDKI